MTSVPSRGGSSLVARGRTPSVRLDRLAQLLARAIAPEATAQGPAALPFISVDEQRLRITPRGVISRLSNHPDFAKAFSPGEDGGFLVDMDMPPFGTRAKTGGRLVPGSEAATSKQIDALYSAVARAVDDALGGRDVKELVFPSTKAALTRIADSVDESLPTPPAAATMVPVQFGAEARRAEERARDVARVFTAIETIDGADCLESLLMNIAARLRRQEMDEDEIDAILQNLRLQRQQETSQLRRFFDFLDDEALARVRLVVGLRLMEAVAEHASSGFAEYVSRVAEIYRRFGGPDAEALPLDVSNRYGQFGRTQLEDHLRQALCYDTLPVWPEWAAQLFEKRAQPAKGFITVREVSYRFRVNGMSPTTGEPAFDSRLMRLESRLDPERPSPAVRWSLAELVFLHLAVPFADRPSPSISGEAARVAGALKRDPDGTISELLASLRSRAEVVQRLTDDLLGVVRSKSKRVVDTAATAINRFTVSVNREVVNWEAVLSMSAAGTEILRSGDRNDPNIEWFRHLTIAESVLVPGSLASYTVGVQLKERALTPSGEATRQPLSRPLDLATHLPIRLVPYSWKRDTNVWSPDGPGTDAFDAGRGVEITYDPRQLTLSRAKDDEKARTEQLRTATASATAMLVYVALWELIRRLKLAMDPAGLTASILRLQVSGRDVDDTDGSAAVYTISQALEKALSREIPVKLQGFVSGEAKRDTLKWRKRGTVHAMLGGQPLEFTMDGALDRVALVSYVTRPCDVHPLVPDATGHLFVSRTYQAVRGPDGKATLSLDRMHSRYVEKTKDFATPQLILEEIARLAALGFQHVMLLSHHFGNRHLGRAAERHAPHGTLQFLDGAIARHPTMKLYTLRRDVFPAMRLRSRAGVESGFEVTQFDDHRAMYQDLQAVDLRSLMPAYTFATLTTPDERGKPQSGFCTYYFDLEERVSDLNVAEAIRANILGVGQGAPVRASLISVLRAVHFMESEKPSSKTAWLPVLDPYTWMTPTTTREAGELEVMTRRKTGSVLLSFPALLSHVTKVLHKDDVA